MTRVLIVALLLGCSTKEDKPAPAVPDAAAPTYDQAALRKAWRESVKYRAAKMALANNAQSLAGDLEKVDRMLETTEAYRRLPPVADPQADAAAVQKALMDAILALKAKGTVEVKPPVLGEAPAKRTTDQGVHYPDALLAPAHTVHVTLANGLVDAPRFMRALQQLDRLFVVEKGWVEKGTAFLQGKVHFFRDLKPVEFSVPKQDPAAIVQSVTGLAPDKLDAKGKAIAEKIAANHAQVEAARDKLKVSLDAEAKLAIRQARFAYYAKHVDAFKKVTWSGLLSGKQKAPEPGKGHGHGHGH